jgi:hypothetical protein
MKIRFLKLSSIAAISFLAVSCANADSDQAIVEEEVVEEVINEVSEDPIDDIFYQVPSPNDLFNVLKDADISYNKDILNDLSLVETFNTKKSKALNFGVYAADLAYVSSLGQIGDASNFFETIRALSKELEIENAMNDVIYARIQENLDASNPDSLFSLSNETYYKAYAYLDDNDRGDVLGMIVIGGWIEGLNIILNVQEYEENSDVVQRIADQRLTLENLLVFTSRIQNEDLDNIISELAPIEELFSSLEISEEADFSAEKSEEGVMMFGGGSTVSINEEQFNKLKSIVGDLRSSIVDGTL